MIVPNAQIRELLSGEACDELVIDCYPPEIGQVVEIRPARNKRPLCSAKVADHWPCKHGGTVVRFEGIKPIPALIPDRYLARQGGKLHPPQYTSSVTGAADELAAVPEEWEAAFGLHAEQSNVLRNAELRRQWEEESIVTRLEAEIMEAERLGIDPGREMARLEAGISALKRRNAIAKQQRGRAA